MGLTRMEERATFLSRLCFLTLFLLPFDAQRTSSLYSLDSQFHLFIATSIPSFPSCYVHPSIVKETHSLAANRQSSPFNLFRISLLSTNVSFPIEFKYSFISLNLFLVSSASFLACLSARAAALAHFSASSALFKALCISSWLLLVLIRAARVESMTSIVGIQAS